jgi:predicted transposase YdaD
VGVLMGLRYPKATIEALLPGASQMKESTFYQGILEEGRAEGEIKGARKMLLRQGQKRHGLIPQALRAKLESVNDLEHLGRMSDRVDEAADWQDLLNTP